MEEIIEGFCNATGTTENGSLYVQYGWIPLVIIVIIDIFIKKFKRRKK